ncbi:MAG: hypothetical protein H6559_12235 [Lewinellaceae bacterium]|nr:hypothetical protein [Lewinellaceae bacterium]
MPYTEQPPLNDIQLTLLRLFSREMSTDEVEAIRRLLLDYYEHALQGEVQRVIEERIFLQRILRNA